MMMILKSIPCSVGVPQGFVGISLGVPTPAPSTGEARAHSSHQRAMMPCLVAYR